MAKFEDIAKEVLDGVAAAAKQQGTGFEAGAQQDAQAFLDALKADLLTWTMQVAAGQLSKDDFVFLVRGKKDLAQMHALTEAGLGAAGVDKIQTSLINLVVAAALKSIV